MSKITFHYDAGHGWYAVPMADVLASGADISAYSYQSKGGRVAYLEEDCDMSAFVAAIGGAAVLQARYPNNVAKSDGDTSWIRYMPHFCTATAPRLARGV